MKRIICFVTYLILFLCFSGCVNKTVNVSFCYDGKMKSIEVDYKTIITNNSISWIDCDNIEGLYLDSTYSIKYNNEKIKEDITIFIKIKEVKVTLKYDNKEEVVNIKKSSILSYDLITLLNSENIEGLYLDSHYTVKYNNEEIYDDTIIYILSYDKIEELMINQYVKKEELENTSLVEYYKIGEFSGYNIGVWKKLTVESPSFYQEIYGEITVTLGFNCELLAWKDGEFHSLKKLYESKIITDEMILQIESFFNKNIEATLSPVKTSGLSINENKIISTYEEFYEIFYSDEERKNFYIERGLVYDEEFFKTKSLVFAYFTHNVSGNFVGLVNASVENNNLYINILLSSGFMHSGFRGHLVVEVNTKDIFNVNNIILNKKIVDDEIRNITFIIDGKEEVTQIKMLQIVTKELIHTIDYNTVEGLYLDPNYTVKYNNYNIYEDTVIYVRIK